MIVFKIIENLSIKFHYKPIISMIKDAYEDYKRFVSDQSENKAQTTYLEIGEDGVTQKWVKNHWKDINCGMIVKVVGDE